MQDDTEQLQSLIESSVQGLLFRTEGDYELKSLVWNVSEQEEFNISRLLKSTKNLEAIELDDFLGWGERLEDCERWEEFLEQNPEYLTHEKTKCTSMPFSMRADVARKRAEEYKIVQSKAAIMKQRSCSLLEVLQAHVTNLQVYRVVKYDESEYNSNYSNDRRSSKYVFESFKILVAKVNEGCWIGISPIRSHIEFLTRPTPEKFLAQRIEPTQVETRELQAKLKPILDSITFIGRQCYDVFDNEHQYACEFAATEDAVIDRLLHLSHFLNTWEFEGMSLGNEGLEGVGDPDDEDKFEAIDQLLRSHLRNLRVHIVGTISMFDVYAVGQAKSNDWLGVSTTAVWT
jgi:hypothetical protein